MSDHFFATTLPPLEALTDTGVDASENRDYGLVMLHGWGADARDLAPLAGALRLPRYRCFFVNAPFPHPQLPQGRAWYNLESTNFEGLDAARETLRQWLLNLSADTEIPLERIVLGGFSQGGAMSLDVGLSLPLAGVFALSGYLHFQPQPIPHVYPPVLMVHGNADLVVPIQMAEQAVNELRAIGVDVTFHPLSMAHEIPNEVLGILRQYLLDLS